MFLRSCGLLAFSATLLMAQFEHVGELKIHPQAVLVPDHVMNLPSGELSFQDVKLAQVFMPWEYGAELVVAYVPVRGAVAATIRFERSQDGRVAKHNFDGIELLRRNQIQAVGDGDVLQSVTIRKDGLLFSSIDIQGTATSLSVDERKSAEKAIRDFNKQRSETYYPTDFSLDPLMGSLCGRLNHKGYLYFDYSVGGSLFGFFVDAFRNFKMGVIAFDRFDGTLKAETFMTVDLIEDLRFPQIQTLRADQLTAYLQADDLKSMRFDTQVTYTSMNGGERYLYLDLFSERAPKRFKSRDIEQHELNYGSLYTAEGNQDEEAFGRVALKELIHYPRNASKHAIDLHSVTNEEGDPLRFAHLYDALIVELPQAPQAGESFTLKFSYSGAALAQDFGYQLVHFDEYAWWPRPYFYNARPAVSISYSLPRPWVMVAPGKFTDLSKQKKVNAGSFVEERRVLNPNIILGNLKMITHEHKDFSVHYYAYAQQKRIVIKKIDKLGNQYLQFYANLFGVVPFEQFSVVEIPTLQRMEHAIPGVIAVDEKTFNRFSPSEKGSARVSTTTFRGINESLAVGLAGLWWHSVVQPGSAYEAWFGPGFSEYSAYLMMTIADREDVEGKFIKRWKARGDYVKDLPISHAKAIVDHESARVREDLLQYKAASAIHQIREDLADDQKFVLLLSGFLQRANFRNPSTLDFLNALQSVSGEDTASFYQDFLVGFQ